MCYFLSLELEAVMIWVFWSELVVSLPTQTESGEGGVGSLGNRRYQKKMHVDSWYQNGVGREMKGGRTRDAQELGDGQGEEVSTMTLWPAARAQ